MRRQRLRQSIQTNGALDLKHGTRTDRGTCHDCTQGMLASYGGGFEYWNEEGDGRGFWFCRYCGSNHVTVTCDAGVVIEQGDLYDRDGFPNVLGGFPCKRVGKGAIVRLRIGSVS